MCIHSASKGVIIIAASTLPQNIHILYTGCSLNIVFFSEDFEIFRTLFSLGASVCTHTRQVEHQRCGRTGRVQKNHKLMNTL